MGQGRLSSEGCFDLLAFEDLENKTGAALVLDANYYLDAQSHEKRLRARANASWRKCPRRACRGKTDEHGFVVTARGKENIATYRYDKEGYPLGKTTTAKGERLRWPQRHHPIRAKIGLYRSEHLQ